MKILYFFKEKDTHMDGWQRVHIFNELEKHGCHVTVYNPLEYASLDEANEELLSLIHKDAFDLFMTPHGSTDLFIETLSEIKKQGIPTLLICYDNLLVPFHHRDIAPHFDLVWLTSKETQGLFVSWGAKVIFNPYAANPYFFKPNYKTEIERIAFIGTPYGSRVNILNTLTEHHINVTLYSNITSSNTTVHKQRERLGDVISSALNLGKFHIGRKVILGALKQKVRGTNKLNVESDYIKLERPVGFDKLSELYSNYALSLASTAARNTGVLRAPVNVVNLRSFEVPMSGGLQFCLYFDELASYFEDDKEILFYRTNDELIEKASFYLRSESANIRVKLKQAARRRAENEHTWFCRFSKVFDRLGLKYK